MHTHTRLGFGSLHAPVRWPLLPEVHSMPRCHGVARGLTFVQGHRHTVEWAIQATLLRMSEQHWLVQDSDLLMHTNNRDANMSELRLHLALYPHAQKVLENGWRSNSGKRCGALEAIASQHSRWRCYEWVLFLHPDMYLLPGAVATLGAALKAHPATAFLVQPLYLYSHRSLWNTDLFAWRPPQFTPAVQGVTEPRNVFDGMCLSRRQPNRTLLVHADASPERSLFEAVHQQHLSWCELAGKKPFLHQMDLLGIWHSHSPDLAIRFASKAVAPSSYATLEATLRATMSSGKANTLFTKAASYTKQLADPAAQNILRRSRSLSARFSAATLNEEGGVPDLVSDELARFWSTCQRRSGEKLCAEKWEPRWGWLCASTVNRLQELASIT